MAVKGPDRLKPETFGEARRSVDSSGRPLGIEETVARQLDRILYYRSEGFPWGEALQGLRAVVSGLEDKAFQREWDNLPVRAVKTGNGETKYLPSNEDLHNALMVIMRLLARKNVTYQTSTTSEVSPPPFE